MKLNVSAYPPNLLLEKITNNINEMDIETFKIYAKNNLIVDPIENDNLKNLILQRLIKENISVEEL